MEIEVDPSIVSPVETSVSILDKMMDLSLVYKRPVFKYI